MVGNVESLNHHGLACVEVKVLMDQSITDTPWHIVLDQESKGILKLARLLDEDTGGVADVRKTVVGDGRHKTILERGHVGWWDGPWVVCLD